MKGKYNMNKRKILLLIFVLLGCAMVFCWTKQVQAIDADITAIPKPAMEINGRNASEAAYQEFLNGKREIFIEEEDAALLEYTFTDTYCGSSISMEEVLEELEVGFSLEEYNGDHRIETIEYAYIDSYNDGNKELAVRFTFHCGVEHISLVFIVVYEEDTLYLRHILDSWNRFGADLYNYGRIIDWGSGGAFTTYDGESFLGKDGRTQTIYEAVYEWGQYEPELFGQVFGLNESNMAQIILKKEYRISDKEYVCLQMPEKDDIQEMLGENLTQEKINGKWEEFCKLYEERNGELTTQEEIDEQIRKRRKELGISQNWVVTAKPDWKLVENPVYIRHVKGIELVQNRNKRDIEKPSILNPKWIVCEKTEISYPEQNISQCFGLSLEWQSAIEYAISDYLKKGSISPSGDWSLKKVVSYGDHLFAVTVRGEDEREICLLITDNAINFEMPEYTEYIVVADFELDDKREISWNAIGSYDSMLDWYSYEQHAENQKDNPYLIQGSDNVVFMYKFEISGKYAMNQYLMDRGADLSEEWIFDKNAVCPISEGRMGIVRYYSDDQEVVMVLDDQNETFAIVKGPGE